MKTSLKIATAAACCAMGLSRVAHADPTPPDVLWQTLATTAGDTYDLNFYLNNTIDGGSNSGLSVNWGGTVNTDDSITGGTTLTGAGNFGADPELPIVPGSDSGSGWVDYDFTVIAPTDGTVVSFSGYNIPSWIALDRVFAQDITDPTDHGPDIVANGSFEDPSDPYDGSVAWTVTPATVGSDWYVSGLDGEGGGENLVPPQEGSSAFYFGAVGPGTPAAPAPDQGAGLPIIAATLAAVLAFSQRRRLAVR
jgi:hypothetical protein